jgi:uncharacterized protein
MTGSLEEADAAIDKGDYATALRVLRPLAKQGNADAQARIGMMYRQGEDWDEAMKWFRSAADQEMQLRSTISALVWSREEATKRG